MLLDIFCFQSGEDFLAVFKENSFDMIFMDIYMNGITGIETAKKIRKTDQHCLLIFLTTSTEHMPDAFSCHAFEYVQKPVNEERIMQVMIDAKHILPIKTKYIELSSNRQNICILYDNFVMAIADKHYLNITDAQGNTHRTRQTLSELVKSLHQDKRFLHINKGILVNMEYIISVEENICTMKNGQSLPIKIRDSAKIKETWHQYGFEQIRIEQKRRKS